MLNLIKIHWELTNLLQDRQTNINTFYIDNFYPLHDLYLRYVRLAPLTENVRLLQYLQTVYWLLNRSFRYRFLTVADTDLMLDFTELIADDVSLTTT